MDIYNYSGDTNEYKNMGQADESPLEPGVFLVPALATSIKPPEFGFNEIPVFNELNNAWEIKPDYRNATLFSKETGEKIANINIGDTPDYLNATDKEPPSTLYKFDNGKWVVDDKKYSIALNEAKENALNRIEKTADNYQRMFLGANSADRQARFQHNLAAAQRVLSDNYDSTPVGQALKSADLLAMQVQADAQNLKPETTLPLSAIGFANWVVEWLPKSVVISACIENILVIGRTELNKITDISQIEPFFSELAKMADSKFSELTK